MFNFISLRFRFLTIQNFTATFQALSKFGNFCSHNAKVIAKDKEVNIIVNHIDIMIIFVSFLVIKVLRISSLLNFNSKLTENCRRIWFKAAFTRRDFDARICNEFTFWKVGGLYVFQGSKNVEFRGKNLLRNRSRKWTLSGVYVMTEIALS